MMTRMKEPTISKALARREGTTIIWKDGMPVPAYVEPVGREALPELGIVALSLPYKGSPAYDPKTGEGLIDVETGEPLLVIEKEFRGMTNAEVMMIRMADKAARGSNEAFDKILDRVIGRPKQVNENLNMTMSYEEYLAKLAEEEDAEQAQIIEVKEDTDYEARDL